MDNIKPMIYSKEPTREVLADGEYLGYRFIVLSLGWHPIAYIRLESKPYNLSDLTPHGGITYSSNHLDTGEERLEGFWVGWDYSHYYDYNGLTETGGFRHTTEEIISECKRVIEEVAKL